MSQKIEQLHAILHGRVQGVNFRATTTRKAKDLGLSGWVTNRSDGTVEVIAQGDRSKLEQLLEFLHQGPPAADVQEVDHQWEEIYGDTQSSFDVKY